jgi:signal transduction histidine kinase
MLSQPLLYLIAALCIFFFFSIVNFLQYLFNRDKAFLYYSAYLFVLVIYLGLKTACFGQNTEGGLESFCLIESVIINPINILMLIMYYQFVQTFVDYERYDKRLYRLVRLLIFSMFIGFLLDILILLLGFKAFEADFYISFIVIIAVFSLWCVAQTYRIKNNVVLFIIVGSTFFYIGSIISLYLDVVQNNVISKNVWTLAVTYEYIGTFFEIICFSVGLSYRSYMTQVEKNKLQAQVIEDLRERQALQIELHTERDRIATEMHDDLGAGLSTLKLLGERAKTTLSDEKSLSTVNKMTNLSNELIERLVTIIWAMNSQNDTVEGLISYLHRYANDFLEETHGLACHFPLPDLDDDVKTLTISGENRRRLFLVFKESLHNIIKHSKAKHVHIAVVPTQTAWIMTIDDDGVGLLENKNEYGNGLKNMLKHSLVLKGQFAIEQSEKGGVSIHLMMPFDARNKSSLLV